MALPVILDGEALVGGWLREHPDVMALDARVAGRTPDAMTAPWVRVTQLDARALERSGMDHWIDYTIQLDCYAGSDAMRAFDGQATANLLGATTRAVLKATEGTTTDDAVIARVAFSTHMRAPDTTTEPAMERVIIVADLLMRPA